ncbi:pentapeptide repeat-containing protein [Nodularia sp. UHCC 0506]|uniref:pentapeptide repeat-containing protein n=1 Tax=Nodularia sp. UHCC 0506 TaxID=3110243 RepID=UPI002B1F02BE|nr:pentapeptide repeat-containing protein [Nodularia sp. UHCC 0506]MEA5515407.1 pentapeptide repeat-containing protein [Nodularia sp. UHCC 0506]
MIEFFFKRKGARRSAQRGAEVRFCLSLRWVGMYVCVILAWLFFSLPAGATQTQPERIPLSLELLQERLHTPIIREGNLTVDLREMVIDLRPENTEFRDNFYQVLRKELQRSGTKPLGLDLSNSLIQGNFVGSDLGLRTPLYAPVISGEELGTVYAPLLTSSEQEQLAHLRSVCLQSLAMALPNSKDCRALLESQPNKSSEINIFRGSLILVKTRFTGEVQFPNTFFFQPVNAKNAIFLQPTNWMETRFSRSVRFTGASFRELSNFKTSVFFEQVNFEQAQFQDKADFQDSTFEEATKFNEASFKQSAKFNRAQWRGNIDFSNVHFTGAAQFTKANFHQYVFFTEAIFDQTVNFRETIFNQAVNLHGASIFNQADFSDARFAKAAFLNVPGLIFNSNQGKILGNPGEIGKMFRVPTSQGNQNILRNLGQNFRQQQQIADANQLEYTKQKLRLRELSHRLMDRNINSATRKTLINVGLSAAQADAIARRRMTEPFRNSSELLSLADIDLETYNQLSDRLVIAEPLSPGVWLLQAARWLALSVLLLLSGYGTSFWLVFGVGGVAIAYFGGLFWLVDRYRRLHPVAIIPTYNETMWMFTGFSILTLLSLLAIFRNSEQPWLTLVCLLIIIVPLPITLLIRLYQQGRYHDLMDISYFTEDGTFRQLRLLIGRLPVIPRYQMFRERYMHLLWNRHWNWLNYYDFSLNNLVRLGFNDIRLRDEHLPGIIATLAWYQWSLGILYITLVLWTLSRTIPGLNLLIYLK